METETVHEIKTAVKKRAKSVLTYLFQAGIAKERLCQRFWFFTPCIRSTKKRNGKRSESKGRDPNQININSTEKSSHRPELQ